MNTETSEVENKIPKTSDLVTTNVLSTKVSEIEKKFLIILDRLLLKMYWFAWNCTGLRLVVLRRKSVEKNDRFCRRL